MTRLLLKCVFIVNKCS